MSERPSERVTASRPDECTSGSCSDASPKVNDRSPVPSRLIVRRLLLGGYGIV